MIRKRPAGERGGDRDGEKNGYGERLTIGRSVTIAVVLGGVALTSGIARPDAYGSRPVAGAVIGLLAGMCYAAFILVLSVLVWRFVATGGLPMLRAMNRPAGSGHGHGHADAG